MSKRILYVSYDEQILIARRRLLEQHGYVVTSALGFKEAMNVCGDDKEFQLFILGHAIPPKDKERLIAVFRQNCSAPILSLWRRNERVLDIADYVAFSDDPAQFLKSVAMIFVRYAVKAQIPQTA
jgi:DNA-binding response OmpR family regulator